MKEQLLSEAKKYISRGLPIFPVHIGWDKEKQKWTKQPLIKKWEQLSATTEEDLLKWSGLSGHNGWGLVTGEKSGILVLDIDNPELITQFNLPHTPRVRSISGGYHYYFDYPFGIEVKSHKGLLPKVDIRANKGFIVIPPSGEFEKTYVWEVALENQQLAQVPTWLLELLETVQSPGLSQNTFSPELLINPGDRHKTALQAIGYFSRKYHNEELPQIWQRLKDWMKDKFTVQFGLEEMIWLEKSFDHYASKNIESIPNESSSETVSNKIIKLITGGKFDLLKTEDKKTYIGLPNKPLTAVPTDSEEFFELISFEYLAQYGAPVMKDALKRVMPTIRALIYDKGEEIELANRVAIRDGIYYDLFDDKEFVKVDDHTQLVGAEAIKKIGVRFVRYSHQRPQVKPNLNASISDVYALFDFIPIKDKEQQQLLICHLVTCLIPEFARCMLVLHGSRGSAKSTTLKILRDLIDPAKPDLVRLPDKDNDLQIFLEKNFFCCFDNVSTITKQVSDSLAMMITGGGTISRKLFTDNEIVTTNLKAGIALNGINLAIREPDLLERSLIIETKRLESVKSEEMVLYEFRSYKDTILGGLFALLGETFMNISDEPSTFRMASYYRYMRASAKVLGISSADFKAMFERNVNRQNEAAIEGSPLALVVVDYMTDKVMAVEERSSELFKQLSERAKEIGVEKSMPRGAHMLWKRLNLLRIDLEAMGITLERINKKDATYIRIESKDTRVAAVEATEAANSF